MPSPAELLAQQHAAQSNSPANGSTISSDPVSSPLATKPEEKEDQTDSEEEKEAKVDSEDEDSFMSAPAEKSFPVLGSGVSTVPTTPLSWGPVSRGSPAPFVASTGKAPSPKPFSPSHVKASNTQITFIIDAEQQIPLTKSELFKVLANMKSKYSVNVESTFSSTSNNRTFLLSGPSANIEKTKRDIVKQLTKPVKIEFSIPSKLRSTIIGPQGRTLKPIIEATGVKIDISKEDEASTTSASADDDEELFGSLITVQLSGDIEGCEDAKARILKIVDENTKNLSVKVPIIDKLIPFMKLELKTFIPSLPENVKVGAPTASNKYVSVQGSKDSAIKARDDIKALLASLEKSIFVESRNVPKTAHQFLDSDMLFEKVNVTVEVPDADSSSSIVVFTGTKQNITKAIELGRSLANDYITDILDIGRSHGGNLDHAKNLLCYFQYTNTFDELSKTYKMKINAPSYKSLSNSSYNNAVIQFSCFKDQKDDLKKIRKDIIDQVNKITPSLIRSIDDISSFIINHKKYSSLIEENSVAKSLNITLVPVCKLSNVGNKLLMVLNQDDDDFLPSLQEISEKFDKVEESLAELKELSNKVKTKVASVSKEDQEKIDEASLRLIINKCDSGSIDIKLGQNEKGESEDEILMIGFEKEINSSINEINQLIDDIKNYEVASKYNTTVQFPTAHLSKLIGQKGAKLNALQQEFNVRVDIQDNNEKEKQSEQEETTVKLTGVKSNVDECIKRINQLGKKFNDEKTVILKVEQKYQGKVIGKNGAYANRLRDRYNVILRFGNEGNSNGNGNANGTTSSPGKDEILIRGPSKSVAKVEEEIKELVQYEKENGFQSVITVPSEMLPRLIGKNGEVIKDISVDSGVEIYSKRGEKDSETAELELTGSKKGIKEATDRINKILDRLSNHTTVSLDINPKWHKNLVGPSGSTRKEIVLKAGGKEDNFGEFRKLLQIPNKDAESKQIILEGDKRIIDKIIIEINKLVENYERITKDSIEIPKKKHKLLIGFGGSTKRNIQDECHVFMDIPSIESESLDIQLKGLPEDIEKAKAKILDLTK